MEDLGSAPSALTVVVQHLDGHADVLLIGELDIASVPVLRAGIDELITLGHRDMRLNLSALRFCDAGGLGAAIGLRQRLHELGGELTVGHARGVPLRLLTICGMLDSLSGPAAAGTSERPGSAQPHHRADSASDASGPA